MKLRTRRITIGTVLSALVLSVVALIAGSASAATCAPKGSIPFAPIHLKSSVVRFKQVPHTNRVNVKVSPRKGYRINPPTISWHDTKRGPAEKITKGSCSRFRTDDSWITFKVKVDYRKSNGRWGWESTTQSRKVYS